MQTQNRCSRTVIVGFILAGVCLLTLPATAQQAGPSNQHTALSDDDFVTLNQQITELKNPTFRAFLRMRLLTWESAEPGPLRRQTAIDVATRGVADLCEHQNEVWSATAAWLYDGLVKRIQTLQSSEETGLKLCVLKTEKTSGPEKNFSSAMKMLQDPETSAAGLDLAKAAILSGQISGDAMLGPLLRLQVSQSPHLSDLLSAVLLVEEKQPGTLPLRSLPFFSSVFLDKSVAPEVAGRFVFVAVRASRLSAEEFAKPAVRGPVTTVLNAVAGPAKRLAPELYPEIAGRLSSLNPNSPNITETRLAAEERILKASDQLEQLISEADSVSDEGLKTSFFVRAARLAKDQGQFSRAVDLVMKTTKERAVDNNGARSEWPNEFLSEIVSLALKKNSPQDATYAVSKMTQTMTKANGFRLIGEYYEANQDKVKGKDAFTESAKQLKSVNNSNEKVKASLVLAESVLTYEPTDAYEVFRESIKGINSLPSAEKNQENMYYLNLLPDAEDLIRSFRLLATRENQMATNLAAEIKLSELRLAALSGAYSAGPDRRVLH